MNRKFKIILLILSLSLTLSYMSNTYSRYVADATGNVQALVAKWQILVNENDITNETTSSIEITPEIDENAIYAQARRVAERRMNTINDKVVKRFGGMTNPETGQPIRSADDYFEALEAQERVNARKEIEERGVDPNLLDRLISQNPVIMQAQQIMQENALREGEAELDRQIGEITKMDPTIKSLEDISKMPTFQVFDAFVRRGLSLTEAYRLANFDSLMQRDAAATRQATINAAKGKNHLAPLGGVNGPQEQLVEIPQNERELWETAYPGVPYKELREKYNRSL